MFASLPFAAITIQFTSNVWTPDYDPTIGEGMKREGERGCAGEGHAEFAVAWMLVTSRSHECNQGS